MIFAPFRVWRFLVFALAAAGSLVLLRPANAGLLATEDFDYGVVAGDLPSLGSPGNGFAAGWTGASTQWTYYPTGLTFSDLSATGGATSVVNSLGAGEKIARRQLASALPTSSPFWGGYLVRIDSAAGDTAYSSSLLLGQSSDIDINATYVADIHDFAQTRGRVIVEGKSEALGGSSTVVGDTYLQLFKADPSARSFTSWVLTPGQFDTFKTGGVTEAELNAATLGSGASNVLQRGTSANPTRFDMDTFQIVPIPLDPATFVSLFNFANSGASSVTTDRIRISDTSLNEVLGLVVATPQITVTPSHITLPTIITGGSLASPPSISVAETAGAAGNYNIGTPSGNISVANAGSTDFAIAASATNTHAVNYANNTLVGAVSGNVIFSSGTSGTVADSPKNVSFTGWIYNHSDAEFVGGSGNTLTLNLGSLAADSGVHSQQYQIENLVGSWRALLDLDSISESGDTAGAFTTNAAVFSNLGTQSANSLFDVFFNTAGLSPGSYSVQYVFNLSDEDLPGATTQQLNLLVTAEIAEAAAAPEPATFLLAALGLAGLGLVAWRRGKQKEVS